MANTLKNKKVKKKKTSTIIMVAILLLMIPLVAIRIFGNQPDDTATILPEPSMGNSQSNLCNGGMVLQVGESVYYADPADDYQVYKCAVGAVNGEKVGDIRGLCLNADDKNLFYVDALTRKVMKADLNGGNPQVMVECRASKLMLADSYLYYIDLDSGSTLYRLDKSGEQETSLISNARMMQYAFGNDRIFYHNLNDSGATYYMMITGVSSMPLPAVSMGQTIFTSGNKLFYSDMNRDGAIGYIGLDESGALKGPYSIDTGVALDAVADSEYLYFIKAEDGCIYRQSIADGTPAVKLSDIPAYGLQLAGDYLYYSALLEDGAIGCIPKTATAG